MPSIRRAFAANFLPALALWSVALGLLLAFHFLPSARAAMLSLAELKARWGLGFSMPAQAFAAVLLPFFIGQFARHSKPKTKARDLPFLMLVFAFLGAATDVFYRMQAVWWGGDARFSTLLLKTACDMLLYTPLFCMPLVVGSFAFKDCDYSLQRTRDFLGRDWIVSRVAPVYFSALLVWTPTVLVMYALPLALQFPVQAIVQCLWGLILVVLTGDS